MYCRNCGQQLDDKAAVCTHCGVATHDQPQQAQPVINVVNTNTNTNLNYNSGRVYIHKKKWTAFWLCLLLGWLGVHRFYVGKTATGLIWLFTVGLCGIGWLIDLVMILCGGFRNKNGMFLK